MIKRLCVSIISIIIFITLCTGMYIESPKPILPDYKHPIIQKILKPYRNKTIEQLIQKHIDNIQQKVVILDVYYYDENYDENISYLARVMSNECYKHEYYDMLCVGMTILNRVDSNQFPNTVYGVITQPNQMVYTNGCVADIYYQAAKEVYNYYIGYTATFDYEWINTLYWGASGGTTNTFY